MVPSSWLKSKPLPYPSDKQSPLHQSIHSWHLFHLSPLPRLGRLLLGIWGARATVKADDRVRLQSQEGCFLPGDDAGHAMFIVTGAVHT